MKENNAENKAAELLATANLTQEQVEMLMVKALLQENAELSNAIEGKSVAVRTQWHTTKWSDPNAMVNIFFIEDPDRVEEGSDEETAEETDDDTSENESAEGSDDGETDKA